MLKLFCNKRADLYFFDPCEIEVANPQQVDKCLAELIFDHGQIQPVHCRYDAGESIHLISGHQRVAAIILIREGFTGYDGQRRHDPEFQVKALMRECNEETAVLIRQIDNMNSRETFAIVRS